jgi:hypothetical protein
MAPGVPFRDGAGNSFDKRGESKMIRGDDKYIPRATTNGVQIFQSRNGTEPTRTLSEKNQLRRWSNKEQIAVSSFEISDK